MRGHDNSTGRTEVSPLPVLQSCGEVYAKNARHMPSAAAVMLLDVLRSIATHSGSIDADIGLRHSLLLAQAADKVWRGVQGRGMHAVALCVI
jgi:hypothetical protein